MSEEMHYTADLPYPPIAPERCHLPYARAMLDNLGGNISEMSAVSLYFYNHIITEPCYEEVARAFHKISIVEMRHMQIFGKLAFLLGIDPRLWTQGLHGRSYWTPGYNRYPREIKAVLLNSLKGEKEAIRKYRGQIACIRDANLIENLNRIILDEERHVEILTALYEKYC